MIIDKLSPNYVIIAIEIGKIPVIIKEAKDIINKILISFISFFQIICLLFYLEIFEYNFCSLNKNTKRNVIKRERFQSKEDRINEIILRNDMDGIEMPVMNV